MKGQMVFEFIVAVVILLAVFFYVINYVNAGVFAFSTESKINNLESKAVQISSLLVNDPGVWVSGEPNRIGLEKDWPVLDNIKLADLESYCDSNYLGVLQKLGIIGNRVRIDVDEVSGTNIITCGPNIPSEVLNVQTKRYALSENGNILELNIWVW